jgi:hypothetical protein
MFFAATASAEYAYTTINYPGAVYTDATGINNAGQIVGAVSNHGYLLSGGNFTRIDVDPQQVWVHSSTVSIMAAKLWENTRKSSVPSPVDFFAAAAVSHLLALQTQTFRVPKGSVMTLGTLFHSVHNYYLPASSIRAIALLTEDVLTPT